MKNIQNYQPTVKRLVNNSWNEKPVSISQAVTKIEKQIAKGKTK